MQNPSLKIFISLNQDWSPLPLMKLKHNMRNCIFPIRLLHSLSSSLKQSNSSWKISERGEKAKGKLKRKKKASCYQKTSELCKNRGNSGKCCAVKESGGNKEEIFVFFAILRVRKKWQDNLNQCKVLKL
jgi:hypothetical protein